MLETTPYRNRGLFSDHYLAVRLPKLAAMRELDDTELDGLLERARHYGTDSTTNTPVEPQTRRRLGGI